MLGLPWAMEAMGLGLGTLMLLLSALGAYWGLYLLTIEGKFVKRGEASFYAFAKIVRPCKIWFHLRFCGLEGSKWDG